MNEKEIKQQVQYLLQQDTNTPEDEGLGLVDKLLDLIENIDISIVESEIKDNNKSTDAEA